MLYVQIILLVTASILLVAYFFRTSKRKRYQERLDIIEREIPNVGPAFKEISSFYNYSHYITESERLCLDDKYAGLLSEVKKVINSEELERHPDKDTIERFHKAMSDSPEFKKINNEGFIRKQLDDYAQYFDTVLPYPLDSQQREAVVSLEDNVLVISSAGSGKTLTTVGKVRYLIDVQKVDPSKILLITFTRKAAESLSDRLGEKNLKCRTFHKLALEIIGEATGEMPTIVPQDFSVQVYHHLFNENPSFHRAIADYIVRSRYKMKDQFEYSSMEAYMLDRKKYGVQAYFKDMDGRAVFCKSDEESQICDFLGSRGVQFRYEEKYEYPTTDSEYRQYCPDFSIYYNDPEEVQHRVYLEHFAVNEYGHCPKWFTLEEETKYKEGIRWKRDLHRDKGTVLLETSSAGFHRGDVFTDLSAKLSALGITFSSAGSDKMSRELVRQEENILGMLTAFNFLLKSKDETMSSVVSQASLSKDRITLNEIVAPFVNEYCRMEEEKGEIDFTDAIIRATDLCNNGHRPDYDYILVDEFQDISLDRYRFLQSLRRKAPLTKLFCVGDDWQSIYRFAGSDMALFKSFDKYFGYTKKCLMETTYRFGEPAIAASSKFILANPEQASKNVRPFRDDAETDLDFISTDRGNDVAETVKWILGSIPEDKEVILLGRYSFDVNVLKGSDMVVNDTKDKAYVTYAGRRMNFLTVHQSKGLEADYIILLNCNGGTLGFPSNIADSPILEYVLSEPDKFAYSEERRIFYVGITRARVHTWVLYDMNNPSPFVKEFIHPEESVRREEVIPEEDRCPKCHCGRCIQVKKGIAVNGNPYSVLACSNRKYGCDYQETVFVNLNARRRLPRNKIGGTDF
jgi:DNA helicase-4